MSDRLVPLDQIERQQPVGSIEFLTGGYEANECELVTAGKGELP